jgi:RNA polymerase primary sigma factor
MALTPDGRAIEKAFATLNERGINVVETEEAEADEKEEEETREKRESEETESSELVEVTPKTPAKSEAKEPIERTDDPVRMYLREMGSIGLLSRQGEVAIAKRIEAGREAMIAGLCESPLTFQAVTIWRNELNDGNVFLHDIIDLEATSPRWRRLPCRAAMRRPPRPRARRRSSGLCRRSLWLRRRRHRPPRRSSPSR